MEFKKCERCGDFFASTNNICTNCLNKDNFDISKLKNFFDINEDITFSINDISVGTGISTKNISRFLQNEQFIENKNFISDFNNGSLN